VEETTMKSLNAVSGLWHPWLSFRKPTFKVWEKSELAVRSTLGRLRPRFSMLSGAVFVLVTLFLPIAYNSCGPDKTGAEFVSGASGELPMMAGLSSEGFGRGFYILALTFAAITLGLVILSWARPGGIRNRRWITALYAVAGALSLYLMGDAVCLALGGLVGYILDSATASDAAMQAAGLGLIFIVLAVSLRSKLLRSSKLIFSLLSLGVLGCSLAVEFYFLNLPAGFLPDSAVTGLYYFLATLYWFVPVYLWYRYRLRRTACEPARWHSIRSGILKMYLPALGSVPLLFCLAWDEGVWGFIPFSVGIYLMALGYMRLAQAPTAEAALESATEAASG
jgi:hypothetical protein